MTDLRDPFLIVFGLSLIAMAPFAAMMVTSFIKLVVVFSLLRNALGIQQIPPNIVLNGLAIILTFYVMAPVGQETLSILEAGKPSFENIETVFSVAREATEPLRRFLMKHSKEKERFFFLKTARDLWPEAQAAKVSEDHMAVLIPSFTVSELTAAFEIGFLLYLPFIAIDLIISNLLLAMGMMMVSPMTISLPFKLLLFVLLDGWGRLIHGLILTYV
jgi:type III secretion protein R